MSTSVRPRTRTVSVGGVFDLAVATVIRTKLIDSVCETIVIDFHDAREISDVALADLAATFTQLRCPRVVLRGLAQHQERLLRYLCMDQRAPGAAARE